MTQKPTFFNDKNEKFLEMMWGMSKRILILYWTKLFQFLKSMIPRIILYLFTIWIFISIYDTRGFEETIIVMLVSVMFRIGSLINTIKNKDKPKKQSKLNNLINSLKEKIKPTEVK